ncbi:MAG: diguanylate cyclase [Lacisediminimonas sp.]|nr:diguanylate cyclase [Lacisediminimonas sp.]
MNRASLARHRSRRRKHRLLATLAVAAGITLAAAALHKQPVALPPWLLLGLFATGALALAILFRRTPSASRDIHNSPAFLQSLIDHLPVLVFVRSLTGKAQGRMCVWNKTAETMTGYTAQNVIGQAAENAFGPATAAALEELGRRMLADPMVIEEHEVPFRRPDGEIRLMHSISVPLFDHARKPRYMLGIAEDITGNRRQERALRAKQAELTAAYDASPLGLFQTDPDGRCTYVNKRYESLSGMCAQQALGNGWIQAIHTQDRIKVFRAWRQSSKPGAEAGPRDNAQMSYRFVHADGRIVWASVKTAAIVVDGRVQGYSGTVDDITARLESEQALADSEQRLRTVADTLPALVAYVDTELRLRFNNIAWEKKYRLERDALRDRRLQDLLDADEYRHILPYVERALAGETVIFEREYGCDDDGDDDGAPAYQCDECTYIPQYAEHSRAVLGFHMMVQDISARKREQFRLQQLASVDSLTGLLNRDGFQKRLSDAVRRSQQEQSLIAVMFLDLDHFKSVNDTYGHHIGDLVLQAFAGRLSQALRATDTISRLGGDEFTVIMENLAREEDAEVIAAKIVQAVQTTFVLEGVNVAVGVSVGLAFCQSGSLDPETLLRQADAMLYGAKHDGRNVYRIAPSGHLVDPTIADRHAASARIKACDAGVNSVESPMPAPAQQHK